MGSYVRILLVMAVTVLATDACSSPGRLGHVDMDADAAPDADVGAAGDQPEADATGADAPAPLDQGQFGADGDVPLPPDAPNEDTTLLLDSETAVADDASEAEPNDTAAGTAEPTLPSIAPLDCPTIPAMCPTWRPMAWEQPIVLGFVPFADHPAMDGTAWSEFRPVQAKQVSPHTVRIWATWRNQRNIAYDVSKIPWSFGKAEPDYLSGCGNLKPSLLPTGCVIVDVSTSSRVVTKFEFVVKPSYSWPAVVLQPPFDAGPPPPIECPGVTQPAALPIELTATDGVQLRAFEGHANLEVLESDPAADPSAVVRTVAGTWLSPFELAEAATTVQVPVDVSVCRATAKDIAQSGCACPTAAWPAVAPTPTGDFVSVTSDAVNLALTPSFLSQVEPLGWDGQGYTKTDNVSIDAIKSTSCCHGSACPVEAYDWQCGGTAYTAYGSATIAEVYLARTKFFWLEYQVTPKWTDPPSAWVGALEPGKGSSFFRLLNGLAPRDVPARQRDGVVNYCRAKLIGSLKSYVSDLTSLSAKVSSTMVARCCRMHFLAWSENFSSDSVPGCLDVPLGVAVHLTRWSSP